jgi:hypothetical protein
MSKAFDRALYDADDSAKHLVIKWLEARNFVAFVNPDDYGIDLLARYNGLNYAFEVEVKHNWKGAEFPYQTIHYSARKRKFISPDVKTYFVTLNHERTHLLLVHQQDFMLGKLVNKNTIYTTSEWFVEIPIHRVIFREILEEEL